MRNNFPPQFINAPYSNQINRDATNSTVVSTVSWNDRDDVV